MLTPLPASASFAKVWHRRNYPRKNSFVNTTTHVWIDPSHPEELLDRSRLWGKKWFHPIRFRSSDYFNKSEDDLGESVRNRISADLGIDAVGELRMLTQPRILWWLFNPITIYVLYSASGRPEACLLEVTNTPWKEKHLYSLLLRDTGDSAEARFNKAMHVSPFLGMDYDYHFAIHQNKITIDVIGENDKPVVETAIRFAFKDELDQKLSKAVYQNIGATIKTSAAIHYQALRLTLKRVPFVSHPNRTKNKHRN